MPKVHHHVFKSITSGGISRALETPGKIVDPIAGKIIQVNHMIWDTGATNTCISPRVAQALNLTPISMTTVYTANGPAQVNVYLIEVLLSDRVKITELRVSEANLGPDTDVLVGMDIIGMGDFTVQNCGGHTEFSFCIPPFLNKYDMLEKADKINKRK